ncbi:MAG: hypothetical protein M1465_03345, partial [Candidatus Marsarchaeota archaeon]|nr:hypothetical protein [Candidatus Marsarchaeota archaeon]
EDVEDRRENRRTRENAARKSAKGAVDKEKVRAALKSASGKDADDEAVDAASALLEDRLAKIAARTADARDDRDDGNVRAAHVAVAAQREAEERVER